MFKSLALNEYPPNIGETVMVCPLGICRIVPDGGISSVNENYMCGKGVRPTEAKVFIPLVPCARNVVPHSRPIFYPLGGLHWPCRMRESITMVPGE